MGKMHFNALVNGHTVIMDAPEKSGGKDSGAIPKPFVLTALSGCTGMDVAAILRKSKKEVDSFNIKVSGQISEQQPIEYTAIHLVYEFTGPDENKDAALKSSKPIAGKILWCKPHAKKNNARNMGHNV